MLAMSGITSDYHMHTPRCKHATGPMEGYIERGIALGLREIGFSDHNPMPHGYGANVRMAESELDDYVADVLRLREHYRGAIEVRLGIEMDYVEGLEAYHDAQARRHPWDYIIGSVHYLDPVCKAIAWPRNQTADSVHAIYTRYYTLMGQLAQTGTYDIAAHFDLPKRTGFVATEADAAAATGALQAIARADMCMEINTSGFRHPEIVVPEAYPTPALCAEALRLGIPLCVNSDSHSPNDVGTAFDAMETLLHGMGCRALARFAGRQRSMVPLA